MLLTHLIFLFWFKMDLFLQSNVWGKWVHKKKLMVGFEFFDKNDRNQLAAKTRKRQKCRKDKMIHHCKKTIEAKRSGFRIIHIAFKANCWKKWSIWNNCLLKVAKVCSHRLIVPTPFSGGKNYMLNWFFFRSIFSDQYIYPTELWVGSLLKDHIKLKDFLVFPFLPGGLKYCEH